MEGGDWSAAAYMVSQGAGGAVGLNFSMYVIDTQGVMREFEYSDPGSYEGLDEQDRASGQGLPPPLIDDGSLCGGG